MFLLTIIELLLKGSVFLKYTGFGRRVGAQLIDGLIINSCLDIGAFFVEQVFMLNLPSGDVFNLLSPLFIIFKVWYGLGYWFILLFYEVIFSGSILQATPGKLLLNIVEIIKWQGRIMSFAFSGLGR